MPRNTLQRLAGRNAHRAGCESLGRRKASEGSRSKSDPGKSRWVLTGSDLIMFLIRSCPLASTGRLFFQGEGSPASWEQPLCAEALESSAAGAGKVGDVRNPGASANYFFLFYLGSTFFPVCVIHVNALLEIKSEMSYGFWNVKSSVSVRTHSTGDSTSLTVFSQDNLDFQIIQSFLESHSVFSFVVCILILICASFHVFEVLSIDSSSGEAILEGLLLQSENFRQNSYPQTSEARRIQEKLSLMDSMSESPCEFPLRGVTLWGLSVTTSFGRLTSFLTLRVSYFKHEGSALERKGRHTRESASDPTGGHSQDGSSRRDFNRIVLIGTVLSVAVPGQGDGEDTRCSQILCVDKTSSGPASRKPHW
ncbi:PREDICTED: uncharacterized protein LOC105589036 [Cercocebus atys]|uniref:uncharacterized protein LOC105589036 n=1 Tax=Cercocebus atys TaxID=9531 RepID=UPI0005F4ABEC|nr:PREDICTED: uncharacterized protein LOC105589036 [Cercocebus atys]